VSRSKLNFRRLNRLLASNPAAVATIASATNCCQSMLPTYAQNVGVQLIISFDFGKTLARYCAANAQKMDGNSTQFSL
jgi:hypothetical protein